MTRIFDIVVGPPPAILKREANRPIAQRSRISFQTRNVRGESGVIRGRIMKLHRVPVGTECHWIQMVKMNGKDPIRGVMSFDTGKGWLSPGDGFSTDPLFLLGIDRDIKKLLNAAGLTSIEQIQARSKLELCWTLVRPDEEVELDRRAIVDKILKRMLRLQIRLSTMGVNGALTNMEVSQLRGELLRSM